MKYFNDADFSGLVHENYDIIFCLKTKDEVELINHWVSHYRTLASGKKYLIVIFDNNSSDFKVLKFYDDLKKCNDILLLSYDGIVDGLHYPSWFPCLYETLTRRSKFFGFFDTDEFLFSLNIDNRNNLNFVIKNLDFIFNSNFNWYPSIWINNVEGSSSEFHIGSSIDLRNGFEWGKPLFRSIKFNSTTKATINHNRQYFHAVQDSNYSVRLGCLHVKSLYPMQRIRANFNKLKNIHGLDKDVTLAQFCDSINNYVFKSDSAEYYRMEITRILHSMSSFVESDNFLVDISLDFNGSISELSSLITSQKFE